MLHRYDRFLWRMRQSQPTLPGEVSRTVSPELNISAAGKPEIEPAHPAMLPPGIQRDLTGDEHKLARADAREV
jgi:hypothetical protein